MKMKKLFLLTVICVMGFTAWSQQTEVKESLDAKAFKSKLEATPDAVVLDVRTPEEVSKGKIPGAVNIDFNSADFEKNIAALDKTKTYFVYCAKGGRSSQAVDQMSAAGFSKLYNLTDGIGGWKEARLPLTKK